MPISDAEKPFSAASRADAARAANTNKSLTSSLHIIGRRAISISKNVGGRELFSLDVLRTHPRAIRPERLRLEWETHNLDSEATDMPASQRIHGRKKHAFGKSRRRGGRVLPGALLPYRSIGVLEKKFSEILENSEFVWHGCGHGAVGGAFGLRQTRNSPKPFRQTSPGTSMDCK